ncbi:E3 ubiquitin-protein ligase RNFT1-like [Acropora muricata]|uniref:RING finger and transmembrane domain-containing protein 2-like n=1 Tax=Acropora millepora TaxID=45264 RepID=UPI0010FC9B94|nr:RING finger and transmembrane domain-containing protein 2-like [Acropora millepora]
MVLNWLVPDLAAHIRSDNRHKLKMADHHGVYPSNSRASSFHQRSSHSRSASWSYTSGNGQITLTPLNPIRSVIREFVPSFGHRSPTSRSTTSSPLSPLSPSTYVNITEVLTDGNNLNQTEANRVPSYTAVNSNSGNSSEVDLENGEAHTGTSNNTNGNGRSGGDRVEFQGTINWIEKSLPFVLLLMSRIMWDHRLGILVFIGLCGTFLHANNTVKRQVSLKDRRLTRISLWTFLFLSGNVCFIYYVFYNHHLENCLIFRKPFFNRMDVWTVFWCVGITDFAIRFITMAFKSMVVIQHRKVIPFRRRGKLYLLTENFSQLYRMLVPVPLWLAYFTDYNYGGEYFALIATTIYVLLKIRMIFGKLQEVYAACKVFGQDEQYGSPPSKQEIAEAGNSCPICQEELKDPIMLRACKHIFCEDCISLWFDRERTCPMCRAKVVADPTWRDGSTASYAILF